MPTIAETCNALRQRVQAILDRSQGENLYQKCWQLQTPIHAATVHRFLAGMPMRNDTLAKLEQWADQQDTAQQVAVAVKPGP